MAERGHPAGGQDHSPVPRSPREHLLGFFYTSRYFRRAGFPLRGFTCPWFSSARFHLSCPRFPHNSWGSCAAVIQTLHRPPPEKSSASAMPVLPHEGHDARRGPSQFEKRVSQQFLCCGSLRGLPHQHRVQEAPEDRGDLKHHIGVRGGQRHPFPAYAGSVHTAFLGKTRDTLSCPTTTDVLS